MSNCKSFHEMAKLCSSGYTKDDYILLKFFIIEKNFIKLNLKNLLLFIK